MCHDVVSVGGERKNSDATDNAHGKKGAEQDIRCRWVSLCNSPAERSLADVAVANEGTLKCSHVSAHDAFRHIQKKQKQNQNQKRKNEKKKGRKEKKEWRLLGMNRSCKMSAFSFRTLNKKPKSQKRLQMTCKSRHIHKGGKQHRGLYTWNI